MNIIITLLGLGIKHKNTKKSYYELRCAFRYLGFRGKAHKAADWRLTHYN